MCSSISMTCLPVVVRRFFRTVANVVLLNHSLNEVESFWKESNGLAEENDMDQNLAYMFTMIRKAHGKVLFNVSSI